MAAGDFVVRRNDANIDEVPDAGSELVCLWDTLVSSKGSISYSGGVFTLGEVGRYLVLWSDHYGTTDTTNNERINTRTRLRLGDTVIEAGRGSGYIRKTGGSQEYINSGHAIIDVSSIDGQGDDLEIIHERVDNSTAGKVNRIADRSGITILKLDDAWNYARYETTDTKSPSIFDNEAAAIPWDSNLEQDAPFNRSGADIDIASTNLCLVTYTVPIYDSNGRSEYQSWAKLAGVVVPGSWDQTYPRGADNCYEGCLTAAFLIKPTSGDDLTLEVVSRESGAANTILAGASLQIVELPAAAEACIVAATGGDMNAAATNFIWGTSLYIDDAAFTYTPETANVDVDVADDYLAFASLAVPGYAGAVGARAVPAMGFRVNEIDRAHAGSSSYNRVSGTAKFPSMSMGTLLAGLAANDNVYLRVDRIGTNSTPVAVDAGALQLVRLGSMFGGLVQKSGTGTIAGGGGASGAGQKTAANTSRITAASGSAITYKGRRGGNTLITGGGVISLDARKASGGNGPISATTSMGIIADKIVTCSLSLSSSGMIDARTMAGRFGSAATDCGGTITLVGRKNALSPANIIAGSVITSIGMPGLRIKAVSIAKFTARLANDIEFTGKVFKKVKIIGRQQKDVV